MSTRAVQLAMFQVGFRDPSTDNVLSLGTAEFYVADGTFTTPKNAYDDVDKTNPLTSVTLNAFGQYLNGLYFDGGQTYDIRIKDSLGVIKYSYLDVKVPQTSENVRTVTAASVTATVDDDVILCDTTSNAITVNLYPVANSVKSLTIKNIGSAANNVTVDGDGAELIDGESTAIIGDGAAQVLYSDGTQWRGQGVSSGTSGLLLQTDVFTTSDTWTKPDGCSAVEVWVIGGGGGGGYVNASNAVAQGGGGGGGAYKYITSGLGSTEVVTVGAGGTGGIGTTATTALNGGTSSFGSHCSATGGTEGQPTVAVGGGRLGGAGSGGDININGGASSLCYFDAGIAYLQSGGGGSGAFGYSPGALGVTGTTAGNGALNGNDASGHGGGGSGGYAKGTSLYADGGDGSGGIVIVKSYT